MVTKSTKAQQNEKGWTIRRSDSKSSIGTYRTQKEAIRAAEQIIRQENTNVFVFEKKPGAIRVSGTQTPLQETPGSKQSTTKQKNLSNLSPKEKSKKWREWAASHSHKSPLLSDDAISRKSIYEDRG